MRFFHFLGAFFCLFFFAVVPSYASTITYLDTIVSPSGGSIVASPNDIVGTDLWRGWYFSGTTTLQFDRVVLPLPSPSPSAVYNTTLRIYRTVGTSSSLSLVASSFPVTVTSGSASFVNFDFAEFVTLSSVRQYIFLMEGDGWWYPTSNTSVNTYAVTYNKNTKEWYSDATNPIYGLTDSQQGVGFRLQSAGIATPIGSFDLTSPCVVSYGDEGSCVMATSSTVHVAGILSTPSAATVQFQTRSVDGSVLYDSAAVTNSSTTSSVLSVDLDTNDSDSLIVSACLIPEGSVSFDWGGTNCALAYVGNGIATSTLESQLQSLGIGTTEKKTAWQEYGCDTLGIFEVDKGVICAGIFLFYPSAGATVQFQSTFDKVVRIYPIGYGALLYEEYVNAANSTSTIFDRNINIGGLFGRATSTVFLDFSNNMYEIFPNDFGVYKYLDMMLWFGFFVWLMVWGLTRKL